MKNVILIIVLLGFCLVNAETGFTLTGVGAKIHQTAGTTLINVSGRHSPRAEIMVSDESGKVVASAVALDTGEFNFNFRVTALQVPNLTLFANDPAGSTAPILVPTQGISNALLPPSITIDPLFEADDEEILVGGYSYPGAQVTIQLLQDGQVIRESILTTESDGGWTWNINELENGSYVVSATSRIGVTQSNLSNQVDLKVEDSTIGTRVGDQVGRVVETVVPDTVRNVARRIAPEAQQVSRVVAPVASAGLLTQILLLAKDFIYWGLQAAIALMQYFGFWKRKKPWGVVYDAVTKQPIMLATVRLYALEPVKKLLETDVTSKAGVFSFFPSPGKYMLQVAKQGYAFPSKIIHGSSDGEYSHVYHGEPITFSGTESIVDVSIPMDPSNVNLDWRFRVVTFVRTRIFLLTIMMLVIGAIMSFIALLGGEGGFNGVLFIFYIGVLAFHGYQAYKKGKSWGIVVNQAGQTVEGVELTLVDAKFGRLVQRRVSDSRGKYQFVVPEGEYTIRIDSKDFDLVKGAKNAYQGEKIIVIGDKPKLINFKIVVTKAD